MHLHPLALFNFTEFVSLHRTPFELRTCGRKTRRHLNSGERGIIYRDDCMQGSAQPQISTWASRVQDFLFARLRGMTMT